MNSLNETDIGKRIKKIRKTLNLNQKKFGEVLNISDTSLSEIENGKHKPAFDFLYNITKVYQVNLYYLFFGKGDMFIDMNSAPITSRIEDFAVNVDDVREFLQYFQQSPTLQYFILNHYRGKFFLNFKTLGLKKNLLIKTVRLLGA
jgi:transcriptional regulator with XRE-family HTH domain